MRSSSRRSAPTPTTATANRAPPANGNRSSAIFLDLTEVSLDDDPQRDVRRTVARRDLIGEHVERAALIEELVAARLLATTLDPESDRELVDIIHETLLRNWARLREAIQSARERLQMGVRFRLALREWMEHSKSDDYLLEGVRLAEGRALAAQRDISVLAPDAVELLSRSGQKEQAERERELAQARALAEEQKARATESARAAGRLRKWLIATALAAVLAIGAAGVAVAAFLQADRQARINSSRELAAVSQAQLGVDPELSILLAREG